LTKHFVEKKSVYTEKCVFRRAMKCQDESVNEYAMRLRRMAAHCEFSAGLETEILSQFVVGAGIDEFQRESCRTNDLDIKTEMEKTRGYERVAENVNGLLKPIATGRAGRHQDRVRRGRTVDTVPGAATRRSRIAPRWTVESRSMLNR
jgi:hypothetical protein